jgi:hypothetical protein
LDLIQSGRLIALFRLCVRRHFDIGWGAIDLHLFVSLLIIRDHNLVARLLLVWIEAALLLVGQLLCDTLTKLLELKVLG